MVRCRVSEVLWLSHFQEKGKMQEKAQQKSNGAIRGVKREFMETDLKRSGENKTNI